jgi:CRISPR-associated protein Cmr1
MGGAIMEITVKFETITPLYIGDAWQNCKEIKPSSIMGSLRFWFEVLCYFNGIINDDYFDKNGKPTETLNYKEFIEKLEEKIENKQDGDECGINQLVDETLDELSISLPSRIFGCTGWKGKIRIKKIEAIEDYCFGNKLNLPYAIGIKKDNENNYNTIEWKTVGKYSRFIGKKYNKNNYNFKDWSVWYFPTKYYFGEFEVIFETDEITKDVVLIPLLNFVEKYGYIGGKWNIGYGRVKIKDVEIREVNNWRNISILKLKESELSYGKNELIKTILGCDSFYCKTEQNFKEKISKIPKEIRVIKFKDLEYDNDNKEENLKELIKELLIMKMKMRDCLRHSCENKYNWKKCYGSINGKKKFDEEKEIDCKIDNIKINCGVLKKWKEFRHSIMGSTEKTTQGTKVIPYIYEEKGKLKGGFISIAGVLNIKGGKNDQRN